MDQRVRVVTCLWLALSTPYVAQAASSTAAVDAPMPHVATAHAAAPGSDGPIVDAAPVQVSGRHAGPGMWRVSQGERVLWILATVSPAPAGLDWHAPQVEQVLAEAEEIIDPPGFFVSMGPGAMVKALFALPSLLRIRNNPGGRRLREVLPGPLYERWLGLKAVYLPGDDALEKLRPVFAASELYEAALRHAGLQAGTGVGKRVSELARHHSIPRTSTMVSRRVTRPRQLARVMREARIDDVDCFVQVLDRLEADVAHSAERARAWAIGDMDTLSSLRMVDVEPCFELLAQSDVARELDAKDALATSRQQWFEAVDAALAIRRVSFAMLQANSLFGDGNVLEALEARGYRVEPPSAKQGSAPARDDSGPPKPSQPV